jgi:pre-mRNA-processing factor 39
MVDDTAEKTDDDTNAQSEDIKHSDPDATDLDAENISEDELPGPAKPKVQDAEEVSDEELPGPKMAELPADTEVVSEEELPAPKKRKHEEDYDPSKPSDEADEKKLKSDEEKPKHRLPDLEKYWKAVKADQEDFNAWTYLLQYVDSENDVEAAREAYDSFLKRYCYCYGYWRKYSDYEKKKGSLEKCDEVSDMTFILL